METNLNLFYNEEANVTIRTQQVNEEPWFVAKDVVAALGIGWNGTTLASIPDEWKGMRTFRTPSSGTRGSGEQMLTVIDEAALYKLAFRSNKPQADTFVNWVAGVVLPQIRQTGQYRIKGETECMREQQQRKRLPLPKYRPFFEEWKQRVKFYISREELAEVAGFYNVTNAHVCKVYNGRTASRPIVEGITRIAKRNRRQNIIYPDPVPICEQMVIDWDNEDNK